MTGTSSRDEMCIVPILDTWRNWDGAGSWTWSPRGSWTAEQIPVVLDALRSFARVREALLGGPPDAAPLANPEHAWADDVAHEVFQRSLVAAVLSAAIPINTIDLVVDLRVWVRTVTSPTSPVLGWVRGAATVALYFGPTSPNGTLHVNHTLFTDGDLAGDSNTELYQRNQPLLRDALMAIESRFGPITEVSGLPGITRSGFAPLDM